MTSFLLLETNNIDKISIITMHESYITRSPSRKAIKWEYIYRLKVTNLHIISLVN